MKTEEEQSITLLRFYWNHTDMPRAEKPAVRQHTQAQEDQYKKRLYYINWKRTKTRFDLFIRSIISTQKKGGGELTFLLSYVN